MIDVAPGASPVCPSCGFGSGSGSAPSTAVSGPVLSPPARAWGSQPGGPAAPPPMGMMPGQQRTSGKAIAALVLGIVGCCIWIVPLVGGFLAVGSGIAALVLGIVSVKEVSRDPVHRKGKGMGITGIVLGAIMVLVGILMLLALFVGIAIIDEYCAENADNPACQDYNESAAQSPSGALLGADRPSATRAGLPIGPVHPLAASSWIA